MSKLAEKLRAIGVFNNHDLLCRFGLPRRDVSIEYNPGQQRSVMCGGSYVYSPSHNTDPEAAWYNYGRKAFVGNKADSRPKAVEWATQKYGISEWINSPHGGLVPKYVLDAAKEAIKQTDQPPGAA